MAYADDENVDSTNDTTEEVVNTEEVEEVSAEETTEDTSDLEEKNKKLFERAKKAEAEAKALRAQLKPAPKEPQSTPSDEGSLSSKDLYALMDAKVPQDDVDEVVQAAKILKLPIPQAIKHNVVRTLLAEKAEERRTAAAANTGSTRRGSSKVSEEQLLTNARAGKFPENDEDINRLVDNRYSKK